MRLAIHSTREAGHVRSVMVDHITANTVRYIVTTNVARETALMTEEPSVQGRPPDGQPSGRECGRGWVYTNAIEGAFSIFKGGIKGVNQHCRERHLHRYLAEFDFRYNNRTTRAVADVQRARSALHGVIGKRLTYKKAYV